MKVKVTIELEEGVKATSEQAATTELTLLLGASDTLSKISEDAFNKSLYKILKFFEEGTTIFQRTKNGQTETIRVQNIDEAIAWRNEGDKDQAVTQ